MSGFFLSNFTNKVDKKSRVSVPSSFREVICKDISGCSTQVFIFKSINKNCLEGSASSYVEALNESINAMDPFSPEKDAFSTAIFGDSICLEMDADGRVLIPKSYLEYAGIKEDAFFVGKGKTFEIWSKSKFEEHLEKCRKFAVQNSAMLKWKGQA